MTETTSLLIFFIVFPLAVGTVVLFLLGGKKANTQSPPALLFHSVTDRKSIGVSHFSPDKFASLAAYLNDNKFNAISLRDASNIHSERPISITTKNIMLIFDDGFDNFYHEVLPVLSEFKIKVTLFPVAGYVGKKSAWDFYGSNRHLSLLQIREISDAGHEIGSHTLTHPNLLFLKENELTHELKDSKAILEDIIGREVTSLSFPFGLWNMEIWKKSKELGYTAAAVYQNCEKAYPPLFPVSGVYSFDSVNDVKVKINRNFNFSNVQARNRIMPHFAKGQPVWQFRKNYRVFN